jgi:acetolactate synthase I/II/III large subunit
MAEASLAAIQAAYGPPGRVASLIIPSDCQWEAGPEPLSITPTPAAQEVPGEAVGGAARLLRQGRAGILLGGNALTARGLRAAARVAAATGCKVWIETFPARMERGCHLPAFPILPYFPEQVSVALGDLSGLVLAGARQPVAFFAYPGQPSLLAHESTTLYMLADPDEGVDAALALELLAEDLNAPSGAEVSRPRQDYTPTGQPLNPDNVGRVLAALSPENAIVVNEAATTSLNYMVHSVNSAPHTMFFLTGGAIGQGLPNALGAALACPDRRVIAFQADGSGLYTLQALWSIARENADVTVVVCSNRSYRILQFEMARAGQETPGPKALSLTDLTNPVMDWAALAKGFGVPASTVQTDDELATALQRSLDAPGPSLIETVFG